MAESHQDIMGLTNLLEESRQASDGLAKSQANQAPVKSAPTTVVMGSGASLKNPKQIIKVDDKKTIWKTEEIPTEDQALVDLKDQRPCPRYEMSYKQQVGTQDTFLGMSDKSPATSDCTHLVVKVHCPGLSMKDLDLDVTKERIKVESRTMKLFTYLPCIVDADNGNAKYDTKKSVLTVTLPIINQLLA